MYVDELYILDISDEKKCEPVSRSRLKCPLLVVDCFELTSSLARPEIFFQRGISQTEMAIGKILCREHWDVVPSMVHH